MEPHKTGCGKRYHRRAEGTEAPQLAYGDKLLGAAWPIQQALRCKTLTDSTKLTHTLTSSHMLAFGDALLGAACPIQQALRC